MFSRLKAIIESMWMHAYIVHNPHTINNLRREYGDEPTETFVSILNDARNQKLIGDKYMAEFAKAVRILADSKR